MSNLLKGILLTILTAFSFSIMALLFKLMGFNVSPYEKLLGRGILLLVVAFTLLYVARKKDPSIKYLGSRQNQPVLCARSIMGAAAMLANIIALDYIGLADYDAISKLNTVFLIVFSALILKERTRTPQYIAVVICLAASLFVIKPSFDNPNLFAYLIAVVNALFAALAYLAIRYLTTKSSAPEHPATIVLHLSIFIILGSLIPSINAFTGFEGKEKFYFYLVLSSLASAVGQISLTFSFRFAPSKEISIYSYTSLIFNAMLGYVAFNNFPDIYSWIGYAIISGVGVFLFLYNKQIGKVDRRILEVNNKRRLKNLPPIYF